MQVGRKMRGCEMWARAAEKALSTMDFSGKCFFFSRVTYHRQIREEEPEEPLRMRQSESPQLPQSRRQFLKPGGGQSTRWGGCVAGKVPRQQIWRPMGTAAEAVRATMAKGLAGGQLE